VHVPEPEEQHEPAPKPKRKPRRQSTWSIFTAVEKLMSVDKLFSDGVPVRFLPHTLFVMFLILVYIGNTHYATRMSRSIQKLKTEADDLRADYTTLKSDYMEASKQSEVARKVAAYGLVESSSPPFRITIPAGGLAQMNEEDLARMPLQNTDSLAHAAVAPDSAATAEAEAASVVAPATASQEHRVTPAKATTSAPKPKPAAKPAKAKQPTSSKTSKPSSTTRAKAKTTDKARSATKPTTRSK
jgi:phage shock protein A